MVSEMGHLVLRKIEAINFKQGLKCSSHRGLLQATRQAGYVPMSWRMIGLSRREYSSQDFLLYISTLFNSTNVKYIMCYPMGFYVSSLLQIVQAKGLIENSVI